MAASQDPQLRLFHIRDEIEGVSDALAGTDYEAFRQSYALRRVAERALQIVSKAAKALPAELITRYPAAPWGAIIGIGNVLRHEYQYVDDRRLWEIVTVNLPEFGAVVRKMLADLEAS